MDARLNTNSLSIVIPAYNEEDIIESTLGEYFKFFSGGYALEVIVVCDGCSDKTPDIVRSCARGNRELRLIELPSNMGKGGALIEGFKVATHDIIGFTDADNSITPKEFSKLLEEIDDADGVIASRRIDGSRGVGNENYVKKMLGIVFGIFVQLIFNLGVKDTQCGAKAFKKKTIKEVLPVLKTKGFEFDVELLWRLKERGQVIKEVPITVVHRPMSKLGIRHIPGMLCSLLRVRFNLI